MGADSVGLRQGVPTCDTCGAVFARRPGLWAGDPCLRCGSGTILEVFEPGEREALVAGAPLLRVWICSKCKRLELTRDGKHLCGDEETTYTGFDQCLIYRAERLA